MTVGVGRGVERAKGSPFLKPTSHCTRNVRQLFSSLCYPRKKRQGHSDPLNVGYMTYESKRVLRFSQSGMQRVRRR
jgi:hypothetical protein